MALHGDTNIRTSYDDIDVRDPLTASGAAVSIVSHTNVTIGAINVQSSGLSYATGVTATSNTGVVHRGIWSIAGVTTDFSFSSNTTVVGYFFSVKEHHYVGDSVTGGTTTDITYPVAASSTSGVVLYPIISIESNDGLRWGVKNVVYNKMTMEWTDSQTFVFVDYEMRAACG